MAYKSKQGYVFIYHKGKQVREHRYIWEKYYGEIPKGMIVHHKNQNKADNRIENLEIMNRDVHRYLHHGRHWSEEHKKKISEKMKGKKPKNFYMLEQSPNKHRFKKGEKAFPHKSGCKCPRCTHKWIR